jgi:hypothetical protein
VIRQIVHDELPIDTIALCGVLEYTCGSLVVSMSYSKPDIMGVDMPHKAVLPRTWLQAALARHPPDPLVDQSLSYVLVEPLADLLQQVASQSNAGLCFGFCTIGGG